MRTVQKKNSYSGWSKNYAIFRNLNAIYSEFYVKKNALLTVYTKTLCKTASIFILEIFDLTREIRIGGFAEKYESI